MAELSRVGDLEIEQDLAFERREWAVQRAGWALMALVLLAALLGLFGAGPLSRAVATDENGQFQLDYERFTRAKAPSTIQVRIAPGVASRGTVTVWFDGEYLQGGHIEGVTPEPEMVETTGDRIIYTFLSPDPQQAVAVTFRLEMEKVGLWEGRAGVGEGSGVRFTQLIYP